MLALCSSETRREEPGSQGPNNRAAGHKRASGQYAHVARPPLRAMEMMAAVSQAARSRVKTGRVH